ncbi:DegT/DnrJ/EryC1/StrS aminotransferase [Desulfovibrio sp. X2]|uniref:DegT/DnrJ/EryC1/StrS family aminotransferase n=1 Tax=Desulfovibrio sp. X2 TaxID=941449 RepID=UPI000358EBDF|nr:DegT/DnrJ/EryC1/StrS family aminotransferase [Desulfovibrio sp. X2]EPR37422.1 DegT/DnrJ/EryC1/StrS aminotransferase [Desulfovibrio sp. X2]
MDQIPFGALSPQLEADADALRAAFERVLQSGWFLSGPEVAAFEQEFSAWLGLPWAVSCANGTDAIILTLSALNLPPESRVVLPAFTATPCYHAVLAAGCIPVFAEVDESYYTIDPESLRRQAEATEARAVLAVHLYGQSCDLAPIEAVCREQGLFLIEDCAQAHGTTYQGRAAGTVGDLAAFSFYPTKNLGALGDAGALAGRSEEWRDRARLVRQYGENPRYVSVMPGMNSRMDELQAAFLRVRLARLEALNAERRLLAARYKAGLADTPLVLPAERPGCNHAFHLFVVRVPGARGKREALAEFLKERGIGTAVHYPVPGHRQPMFGLGRADVDGEFSLEITEHLADEVLSLPLWPGLGEAAVDRICAAVREFYGM